MATIGVALFGALTLVDALFLLEEKHMHCTQCGKEISEMSKYCGECGCPVPNQKQSKTEKEESNGLQGATSGIKKQVV